MSNGFIYDLTLISPDEIKALHCRLAECIPFETIVESWQSSELISPAWLMLGDKKAINSVRRQNSHKAKMELQIISQGRMIHGQAGVGQSSLSKINSAQLKT